MNDIRVVDFKIMPNICFVPVYNTGLYNDKNE